MKKLLTILGLFCLTGFSRSYAQVNLDSGLVAKYYFNGGVNDDSGNENNGTVNGALLTTDRFGNVNSAYSFDGINDFIAVPNSNTLNITSNKISICAWTYVNTSAYPIQIISKAQSLPYSERKYGMYINDSYKLGFELRTSSGTYDGNGYNSTTFLNQWCFVVTTYNGIYKKWYVNGQLKDSTAVNGNIVSSNTNLTIGCFSNTTQSFFKGSLDDIRIYDRALTQIEITSLYNEINPTKVNEINNNNSSFNIFPNPTNTSVTIETTNINASAIEIFDVTGDIVFKDKFKSTINITKLTSGVFFVKILDKTGNILKTEKIFKE